MYRWLIIIHVFFLFSFTGNQMQEPRAWIRINQLGYTTTGIKAAVWCSKVPVAADSWQLVEANTSKVVATGKMSRDFGAYGPFTSTRRIQFSGFSKPGKYYLQAGGIKSPMFRIGNDVYKGAADFCLRYMRQQRTGFNPYLKDSCHTRDGYVLYGEKAGIPDSTRIDVVGGWHDASDYLQYSTTSANAAWHLLAAYRDFPSVFTDTKLANGLDGQNGMADVLDEARWGLDWLLKMHPRPDWMFNQIADDRDHISMRMPKMDSQYGRGYERPVYFVSGEPQQRGKFMNATKGTSSTAGKFASAFALGAEIFHFREQRQYADQLQEKSLTALKYAGKSKGVTQTASVKSPYIYAEVNWADDLELAYAQTQASWNKIMAELTQVKEDQFYNPYLTRTHADTAYFYSMQEPVTPWLGADTAHHYQWYPFINLGHYELAKLLIDKRRDTVLGNYREGIRRVWNKAKQNAFYRGIPFIWCSNNLTTSFAIQCYWYRELTGDKSFAELEQANFDWLFGCNPWGTSMVYGLPAWGDTPVDPHSAFTHIKKFPIDGGLVDGPVYTSIYANLIGIKLYEPDEYAGFQSSLAVYHDDYGDYSTNEPTMDGTASLIYLLAAKEAESLPKGKSSQGSSKKKFHYHRGAIQRGDSAARTIALVFTGHEYADGGDVIARVLDQEKIKASFFFTGDFYRNKQFTPVIKQLKQAGHYLGAHSDKHLLYNDWNKRDSLLVTHPEFRADLLANYRAMHGHGISAAKATYFLPPYEWYNDSIAAWAEGMGLQLINFTPGTLSHTDYTTPLDENYRSSKEIYRSITGLEATRGLNGFILLMHIGTDPKRTDKFYRQLPGLLTYLKAKGYQFQRVDQLLGTD